MSAQPPHHSRTAEIDICEVLAGPETDNGRVTPDSSANWNAPCSPALAGKDGLRRYNPAGFGWSGWTNVVFAAVTAIGAFFWALHGFDPHEGLRSIRAHTSEYIYPRPAQIDQAARGLAGTGADLARTGRPESSATSTGLNGSSVTHPFTDQNSNTPLPANPNAGFANGNHSATAAGSGQTNEAGSGRSSVGSNQVTAKGRTKPGSRTKKNEHQSGKSNCAATVAGSERGKAPVSQIGQVKPNQSSIARPFNSASKPSAVTIRNTMMHGGLGRH